MREFGIEDDGRVNPNGGACALGHPVGASGARLVGTMALELRRRGGRYGLATICGGMGQGAATILEAVWPCDDVALTVAAARTTAERVLAHPPRLSL